MKNRLKVRAQFHDFDYLEKLNKQEMAFLQQFCDREYSCNKRGIAGLTKEERSEHYKRQYSRRNDLFRYTEPFDEFTEAVDPTMNPEDWLIFKEDLESRSKTQKSPLYM